MSKELNREEFIAREWMGWTYEGSEVERDINRRRIAASSCRTHFGRRVAKLPVTVPTARR